MFGSSSLLTLFEFLQIKPVHVPLFSASTAASVPHACVLQSYEYDAQANGSWNVGALVGFDVGKLVGASVGCSDVG